MGVELFDPTRTASTVTDSVIVSFSGGKESVVVLDMCVRHFAHVYAFHMYAFPNLSFADEQLRWYEERYGIDIIDLPHPDLASNMHYGAFRPWDDDVPLFGFNDVYAYVRWLTGAWWVAAGERCSDSLVRLAMIRHSGTVDPKRGRFYPLANWNKRDVMSYIRFHHLRLGKDSRRIGYSFPGLEPEALSALSHDFPDDYARIESWFPMVGASVFRQERVSSDARKK